MYYIKIFIVWYDSMDFMHSRFIWIIEPVYIILSDKCLIGFCWLDKCINVCVSMYRKMKFIIMPHSIMCTTKSAILSWICHFPSRTCHLEIAVDELMTKVKTSLFNVKTMKTMDKNFIFSMQSLCRSFYSFSLSKP